VENENPKPQSPISIEDMLRYQEAFVKPVVNELRIHVDNILKPIAERQAAQEVEQQKARGDIDRLKSSQTKALLGWGAYTAVFTAGWVWLKQRFGW
jgi:hypothetical protein